MTDGLVASIRLLRRRPGLSLLVISTFALGIALCTTLFSILQGVLFRPLGIEGGDRLVSVGLSQPSATAPAWLVDPALFMAWRDQQRSFEQLSAFRMYYSFVTSKLGTRTYAAAEVSSGFFEMLDVSPALGRVFELEDQEPGAAPVAVLSFDAWHDHFGGDPRVIGESTMIDRRSTTVIGVMPEDFAFPVNQHIWQPLRLSATVEPGTDQAVLVAGKLQSEESTIAASARLAAALDGHPAAPGLLGATGEARATVIVEPYVVAHTDHRLRRAALPMIAAVLGVLLIACANVASLLLTRAVQRSRQSAIASALGATRTRLVIQVLLESLVLSLIGGAAGLALAQAGVTLFNEVMNPSNFLQGFWIDVRIDPRAAVFVLVLAIGSAALAALLPTFWTAKTDPGAVLRGGARGTAGRSAIHRGRLLLVAELAVTCALLITAVLMIQTIVGLRVADPGFEAADVLTGRVSVAQRPSTSRLDSVQFFNRLAERLEQQPQVRKVAFASSIPTRGSFWSDMEIEGQSQVGSGTTRWLVASPGFFEVLGVGIVDGRDFEPSDVLTPNVAIVNQSFVRRFADGRQVLGRRIRLNRVADSTWFTVVGVVPDLVMEGVGDDRGEEAVYLPHFAVPRASMETALKFQGEPAAAASALERGVAATEPLATSFFVMTMEEVLNRRYWVFDAFARLFFVFGIVALALSTVGLYGALLYSSRSRSREYGIRLAVGARPVDLLRSVFVVALAQVGLGLILGLFLAAFLARFVASLVYGIEVWNPTAYGLVTALMLGSGLAAAIVPARNASRADPTKALRSL